LIKIGVWVEIRGNFIPVMKNPKWHKDEIILALDLYFIALASDEELLNKIKLIEDDDYETKSVWEGQSILKVHKAYERDKKIVEAKKKEVLKKLGTLTCEVCDFNFKNTYGDWGDGYIECHHKLPLGKLKVRTLTKLNDLALVCANCHRMLHRRIDALTVEGLKMLLISNKNKG